MADPRNKKRGVAQTANDRGEAGKISVLGWRQVTPRWADDPVRRHNGYLWRGCLGRRGVTPPEGHQSAGRKGRAVQG